MHDYASLKQFLKTDMKMTHIYQPLMIKKLLESGNTASTEDVARVFVNNDPTLLGYYKKVVMRWPRNTLTKHQIISYKRGKFTLLLNDTTPEQKQRLIELCTIKVSEYVDKFRDRYGAKAPRKYISGTSAYIIFSKSKGVCVACGKTSANAELVVDHILPVNRGGKTEYSNLQALCRTCNAEKRDTDDVDFITWQKRLKYRKTGCYLCHPKPIASNAMAFAVRARRPEAELHSLVVPKRHARTFFDLIPAEKQHCMGLIDLLTSGIRREDKTVNGFSVGFDAIPATVDEMMHYHINVIPRRT